MSSETFINTRQQKKKNINIIPLIDIIFLILIFFMLATNFSVEKEIKISIPKQGIINNNIITKSLKIVLDEDKIFIDEIEISKKELEPYIVREWEKGIYKNIFLVNKENAEIKDLILVMDILKKNSIKKIFIND